MWKLFLLLLLCEGSFAQIACNYTLDLIAIGPVAQGRFGRSVDVCDSIAVTGTYGRIPGTGSAEIYQRNSTGTWNKIKSIVAENVTTNIAFGFSVSVFGDLIAIGAPGDSQAGSQAGAVYFFSRNEGGVNNWGQIANIVSPNATSLAFFGWTVSVYGDLLVVGEPRADRNSTSDSGAAYLFGRNVGGPNNFGLISSFASPKAFLNGQFGYDVDVDADHGIVVIGSDFDFNEGACYVFEQNATGINAWGLTATLRSIVGSVDGNFCDAVAVQNDTIVAGSVVQTLPGSVGGAVFIWRRSTNASNPWPLEQTRGGSAGGERYGTSVAINEHVIVVGATGTNQGPVSGAGRVEVLQRGVVDINGTWAIAAQIPNPTPTDNSEFGMSVSVEADVVLVGTQEAPINGSIYFYSTVNATCVTQPLCALLIGNSSINHFFCIHAHIGSRRNVYLLLWKWMQFII